MPLFTHPFLRTRALFPCGLAEGEGEEEGCGSSTTTPPKSFAAVTAGSPSCSGASAGNLASAWSRLTFRCAGSLLAPRGASDHSWREDSLLSPGAKPPEKRRIVTLWAPSVRARRDSAVEMARRSSGVSATSSHRQSPASAARADAASRAHIAVSRREGARVGNSKEAP
eukprot:scaffold95256_cov31-Tisochrysis_lutea.AAC.5